MKPEVTAIRYRLRLALEPGALMEPGYHLDARVIEKCQRCGAPSIGRCGGEAATAGGYRRLMAADDDPRWRGSHERGYNYGDSPCHLIGNSSMKRP